MFETDGSIMIFWQALGESKEGGQSDSFFTVLYMAIKDPVLSMKDCILRFLGSHLFDENSKAFFCYQNRTCKQ